MTSTKRTLTDYVGSAESFAALRGAALVVSDDASVEDRAAALVALATSGGVVKDRLAEQDAAYAAYMATKVAAQDTRADLAIAMVLLSEQGITNANLATRFAVPGGKSAVATWLTFGQWVLASVDAGGKRPVASGDAAVRAEALSEGWNAVLAAKKAGALKDKSFSAKVAAGAAPSSLRDATAAVVAAKAPKEPQAPVPGVDTPEPGTTGSDTTPKGSETFDSTPLDIVADGSTPEGSDDETLSAGADLVAVMRSITKGIRQAAAILANDPEGLLTPEQIVAAWEQAHTAQGDLSEVIATLDAAHAANVEAAQSA